MSVIERLQKRVQVQVLEQKVRPTDRQVARQVGWYAQLQVEQQRWPSGWWRVERAVSEQLKEYCHEHA